MEEWMYKSTLCWPRHSPEVNGQLHIPAAFLFQWFFQSIQGPGLLFSSVIIFFFTDGSTPWTSNQLFAATASKHMTTQTQNNQIYTSNIHATTWLMWPAKDIPVTGRGGPYGCEILRLPNFLENRLTDGGEVFNFMRRLPLMSRNILGTHSC
jgi:hypothetical protein